MKKRWVALVAMTAMVSGCTGSIQVVASNLVTQVVNSGIAAWIMHLGGGAE